MTNSLRAVLNQYREASKSEREKGNYFERLAVAFLKDDTGMKQEYEDAWLVPEWVIEHRYPMKLSRRVATVSLRTIEIVRSLTPLGALS